VSTIAALVLAGVALATLAVVRGERGHVPNYVLIGRIGFVALGAALVPNDPGVAILVLVAALLGRLRERSYADRFRTRAEALSQFDRVS
jgi:hypothetical protein